MSETEPRKKRISMSGMVPNGRNGPNEEDSASVKRRASISTFTPSISLVSLSRLQKVGDDDEYMFYIAYI